MDKKKFKVLIFIVGLIVLESVSYFLAKLSPFEATLLTSDFDTWLPRIPFFIYFYCSWYLLLFAVPYSFYLKDEKKLHKYAAASVICIVIAGLVFFFFPTTIIRPDVEVTGITTFVLNFIYFTDTPVLNCLPSMHCVLCFLFIILTFKATNLNKWYKVGVITLSLLVVASTMLIKQHVVWDVISGLVLAILSLIIVKYSKFDNFISKKFNKWLEK